MFVLKICLLCHLLFFFAKRISADYSRCYSVDDSSNTLICFTTKGTSNVQSWQDARDYCKANNSTLVSVGSRNVQNVLVQFINDSGLGTSKNWIGVQTKLTRLSTPFIRWIDGRDITVTNNMLIDANVFSGRFFVAIDTDRSNNQYRYHAQMWTVQSSYICQTTGNCTTVDLARNNLCYKKFEASVTWYEASNRCLNLTNGTLATFNVSQPMNDGQLVTWLNGSTNAYWIGLTNVWWIDLKGNDVLYTNWKTGNPQTSFAASPTATRCVLLDDNANQNQWIDSDCDDEQPFICQTFAVKQTTVATASMNSTSSVTTIAVTAGVTQAYTSPSSAPVGSRSSKLSVNLPFVTFLSICVSGRLLLTSLASHS